MGGATPMLVAALLDISDGQSEALWDTEAFEAAVPESYWDF